MRLTTLSSLYAALALSLACAACGGSDDDQEESAEVAAGRKIVEGRLCSTCHGEPLSGATTAYPGTQAFPANLTPDVSTGLGAWSEQQIATAILDGKDVDGKQLCNAMPKYRDMGMTSEQALEVAAYLKSLDAIKREIPQTTSCTAR